VVLNYQPSQPYGWRAGPMSYPSFGMTVGGHTTSKEFVCGGRSYRINLSPSDPVYEDLPADPAIDYRRILDDSFGAHYSFRYVGGLPGRNAFDVQSYSVYVQEEPQLRYGADVYVVHRPVIPGALCWIQVVTWSGRPPEFPVNYLDNMGRANPFYCDGGHISILGEQVFNLRWGDGSALDVMTPADAVLADRFSAEVFLVQDTRRKDPQGKTIVNIFGGIKYGWQVQQIQQIQEVRS
jgi:hypothetical protein